LGEGDIVYTFGQMRYLTGNGNTEDGLYFYHGNHLSSTQLITDINANISQAVLYTPWGSVIKEYKADWMLDTIPRYLFNAKEKDEESGLYYYEARYYSDENIMFIARDPLFEKYFWMSPYAYCNNNPVIYIDPDGRENIPALNWARNKMSNKGIPFGIWFGGASGWGYKQGTVPTQTVCYESCFMAYMNSTEKVVSHLKETGFATQSGGFKGRSTSTGGMNWFKNGDGTDRSFVTDISKGELGDIVFMGNAGEMQGHAVLLNGLPTTGSYKDNNGNTIETMTLNTLSTGTDNGDFGERVFTFEKQKDGNWKQQGGAGYVFRGYGQLNSEFSKQSDINNQ
jgi:RHS repeat-associated protein